MGDINRQLRDYLSRNEARKESSIFAKHRISQKAANDSCLPSLSRKQRIVGFAGMLLMGCLLHGFGRTLYSCASLQGPGSSPCFTR
ncbi:hypothetical protein MTO96_026700 [Rhipicephalus appendiculatus]